ncbi:hypothetical protein [Nostoc sp. MS1]|uniref:hypothetical protein n=1 Tax=Nostoc sp. MS1 TaxID=2764711 RepID=UPI001CC5A60D|nr:hypothetical protein [Nostoc sp. MS1]BCL39461.1 hypothetical protein NSMS1_59080 [Nostoc sp. MS1]
MTSERSKKTKLPRTFSVQIQITTPKLVVIPIPSKELGFVSMVEFVIIIKNNTSFSLPFSFWGCLIPEITAPNGQDIKPKEAINTYDNESQFFLGVGDSGGLALQAQLYWQSNYLTFKITHNTKYWQPSNFIEYSWTFEQMELGKYQLRWIYQPISHKILCTNPDVEQSNELLEAHTVETPNLNLYLVQPSEKYNAVEIDGICMRTLAQQILTVPSRESIFKESIKLAGIRISNNTAKHLHFSFYNTLFPEIIDANGYPVEQSYASDWISQPNTSDFILANPGRHLTFFPGGSISWDYNERLTLHIEDCMGGTYFFWLPRLGNFRIRFNYINHRNLASVYDEKTGKKKQIENIWTGTVVTPFVEFKLREK